jgi:predicted metal-dependent hydrolase
MDHSPQFWDVVASVMPDHLARRKALKQVALTGG